MVAAEVKNRPSSFEFLSDLVEIHIPIIQPTKRKK